MVRIILENNYELELNGNEIISLNYSLNDVVDFTKRNSAYSKTIKVPGTKNNKIVFDNIWNLNTDSNFDPSKKLKASMSVDSMNIFEGYIQLNQIERNDLTNEIYFNITFFSDLNNFISGINQNYLSDITSLDAFNHSLTFTNIYNSWYTPKGYGYVYPFLNTNNYTYSYISNSSQQKSVSINDFKPAIYLKTLVDGIFSDANYTYDCEFFHSDLFKSLILPITNLKKDKDIINSHRFRAYLNPNITTNFSISYYDSLTNSCWNTYGVAFPFTDTSILGFDENDHWTSTFFSNYFTATTNDIRAGFKLNFLCETSTQTNANIWVNVLEDNTILGKFGVNFDYTKGSTQELTIETPVYQLYPGKKYQFETNVEHLHFTGLPGFGTGNDFTINGEKTWAEITNFDDSIIENNNIDLSYNISKIKQVDLFKSILTMFNLLVYKVDSNQNVLYIKQRDEYYEDNTTALDWSRYDIQRIKIEPLSELTSKYINFDFPKTGDYLNESYANKFKENYGSLNLTVDNDFLPVNSVQKIDTIFGTIINNYIPGSSTINLPCVYKLDSGLNLQGSVDSPYLLFYNGLQDCQRWVMSVNSGSTYQVIHFYPFASGLYGDLNNPTFSLSWDDPKQLYFQFSGNTEFPAENLFSYYKNKIDEITDKESKLLTCYINLKPNDIMNLDFGKQIYLNIDGGTYWKLISIDDYNPNDNGLTKVTLLYSLNLVPRPIETKKRSILYNSFTTNDASQKINIGKNNVVQSNSNVIAADFVTIKGQSENNIAIGYKHLIENNSSNNIMFGDNNSIIGTGNLIGGSNNILSGNNSVIINGTGNTIVNNVPTYTSAHINSNDVNTPNYNSYVTNSNRIDIITQLPASYVDNQLSPFSTYYDRFFNINNSKDILIKKNTSRQGLSYEYLPSSLWVNNSEDINYDGFGWLTTINNSANVNWTVFSADSYNLFCNIQNSYNVTNNGRSSVGSLYTYIETNWINIQNSTNINFGTDYLTPYSSVGKKAEYLNILNSNTVNFDGYMVNSINSKFVNVSGNSITMLNVDNVDNYTGSNRTFIGVKNYSNAAHDDMVYVQDISITNLTGSTTEYLAIQEDGRIIRMSGASSGDSLWSKINTDTLQNKTTVGNPYFHGNNSLIFGTNNTSNVYGNKSIVLGDLNYIGSPYAFVAGQNNYIAPFINNSTVLGGVQNKIVNYSAMYITKYQNIIGGSYNKINASHKSTIVGGHDNYISAFQYALGTYNSILGGVSNRVYKGINNVIINGRLNKISVNNATVPNAVYSSIVNGLNNYISASTKYSTIIGGKNYSLTESYTVLVPKLKIANLPSASGSYMLVANSSGNIYKTALPSGTGTSTAVQPGLNTYTGGTSTNPTVNISAATLNNISVTGITNLISASTTYLQVNTDSASTISRERVIVYDVQPSSFSNVLVGIASAQTYAQLNIRNLHNGNQASSDIIATANNGDESTNYIDMGINSSTFTGYVGSANDGYLYSTGNDLWIGNTTSNKSIKLFTDGTGSTNVRVTITSASTIINNLSATTISGGTIYLSGTNLSNFLHNNVDYYNSSGTITGNGGSFGQTNHRWYSNGVNAISITTVALTASSLKAVPIFISRSQIWDKIGFEITAGASGATNYLSAALYSSTNGFPDQKIYQFGTGSTSANTRIIISGDTPTIQPGLYFIAFNHSNVNSLTYRGYNTTTGGGVPLGFDNNNFSSPMLSWSCTNTVSANLPSVFSGTTVATVANAPAVYYHIKQFV